MPDSKQIVWDKIGEHLYETGVDHVCLYELVSGEYTNGVAWNGVSGITENKSGAEQTPLYADNIKYLNLVSLEEYGLTVECYTYPEAFEKYNGMSSPTPGVVVGQQSRGTFGMSFRTLIGNDEKGDSYGYKLHLVYGCQASPSEEGNATINDSPEAKSMSFEISTTPVPVTDLRNTSCITIDSTKVDKSKLQALETMLYGSQETEAKMPLPDALITMMKPGE